ncbi:hypothetical protein AXG55_13660 [Silvanigrella aquatica]|uniref:Uncharacterized protein n=1 Tax=Silvanigrella aquatica TaxID=1915309 RepID=A0A1L4D3Y0_9BACT|nr:hypothetical protein AXG55_13660 [Silvanigrella aquatica]
MTIYAHAQLSVFEKAEGFFYEKQYDKAISLYKNVIENEYSSKKEISFSKCRLALLNNNLNEINLSQHYLEDSLAENVLPSSVHSICTYGLLQIYAITKNYGKAVSLSKSLTSPHLQPVYLARFYALSAEAARYSFNKEFERSEITNLLSIMKKENMQEVEINKYANKNITISDIEERLSILNFESNVNSGFPENYVENVFLLKMKEGDNQQALDILEKNLLKNEDSIILNSGLFIVNSQLRSRLIKLNHDDPKEMRVGLILANKPDRQKYNQNVLRSISAFLSSPAAQGVSYFIDIMEANTNEGSLSQAAEKLIFEKHVHTILVMEGFKYQNDLTYLAKIFSIPVFFLNQNSEKISYSKDLKSMDSLKFISNNGKFKNLFENILEGKLNQLGLESKVFDIFILLRNMQYLANGSQSAQLEKIIREGNWKIDGVSIYEGFGGLR